MTVVFHDHFSGHARAYAAHRPTYPAELFTFLASVSPARVRAWDCGSGSGQAARSLAEHFDQVVASDGSRVQLEQAEAHPRIGRCVALSECSGLAPASVDLVTVAQALHRFDHDAFYREVGRVVRPGGVIAAWCYTRTRIDPPVDRILRRFHDEVVGHFWPPQRRWVTAAYRGIPFDFPEVESPDFEMHARWSLEALLAYLGTWSATRRFMVARDRDPRAQVLEELREVWPAPEGGPVSVVWPIGLRVGRVAAHGVGA